jgi:CHASE1-domain containing sensor protein
VLSLSLSLWINYDNKQYVKEQTAAFTHKVGDLVKKRFELYEFGLLGARGAILVANQQQLTRSSFELYTESRNKDKEFPGALGFGFIKRVSKEQTNDFIEQARRDGAPEFSLRQLNPHQDDRFIIQYIYPQEPNKEAIGLDIGSEANRRNAAIKASLSNEVTLTAPITLVQATGNALSGFLMLYLSIPS